MTDIMQDWKNKRFVMVDSNLGCSDHILIVLVEIGYWAENYELLEQWCDEHDCRAQGMIVEIPDEPTLTLFCLRWS